MCLTFHYTILSITSALEIKNSQAKMARQTQDNSRDAFSRDCVLFHNNAPSLCLGSFFPGAGAGENSPRRVYSRAPVGLLSIANPSESFPTGCMPGKRSGTALPRQRLARSFIRSLLENTDFQCSAGEASIKIAISGLYFVGNLGLITPVRVSVGRTVRSTPAVQARDRLFPLAFEERKVLAEFHN